MAEALLRSRLAPLNGAVRVHSAGVLETGRAATEEAVGVMAARGLDTSIHRSRRLSAEVLMETDLVLGMAREHVRDAVAVVPEVWPRAFTVKELVRRAEQAGGRAPSQPFDEWLAKVHAGRRPSDLLGASADDDVADPIGLSPQGYERTASELEDLVDRLVALVWPSPAGG